MTGTARARALAEGFFAVLVWGASFIATKIALTEVSPVTVVWLRFAMGVAVLGVAVTMSRQLELVPFRTLCTFAVLGLVGITFHQWLQSNALVTSRASTSGWIVATTPVFMAILGRLVLKERLGAIRIAGIALAAVGVVLVVTRGDPATLLHGQFGAPGDALIVISAPNWAVFSVLSRRALRSHPAIRMMAYVMGIGWLFSSVLLVAGPGLSEVARLSARGWGAVAFLGIACSGLAYIAWYDALQRMPASEAGALLYLEPLVAMTVAAALLGERITVATVAGGAVILFGVWLVNRSPGAGAGREAIALGPGEE
ncbi:MAG: DMT family transporter [Acidobacteriia bacterium]|nr:DMT family transporter [Terriglobia bacterium]